MGVPAVWTDAFLQIDQVDLSGYVRSIAVDMEVDAVEKTVMGDSFHRNISGLMNWAVEVEFNQETSTVDIIQSPLTGGTSYRYLIIRQTNAAVSTGNKSFLTSEAMVSAYRPYGGEVGSMTIATASLGPGGAAIFSTCTTA